MKIAILYICIGKYKVFWEEFYKSSEKFFLPNDDKDYFVFTDAHWIYMQENEKIKKVFQDDLGWPYNTLFRFKMFKKVENILKKYDYIFFFNANMLFLDYVGDEVLPVEEGIVVTHHPGYYNKKRELFTYEDNPESLAFIPPNEGEIYVCGGINGGKAKDYIELINALEKNIQADLEKNIIAIWHDESHLNRYIINRRCKVLSPSYAYPEGWKLKLKKIILIRDKNRYGGHNFLRGVSSKTSLYDKIKRYLGRIK